MSDVRIGILGGTGPAGKALAARLADVGYDVTIGSRSRYRAMEIRDVLVAPQTDPAWTPLFPSLAALVTETGGILSHAAIVAREYGIPAVVGAADATRAIATGARVRVDGKAGTVELL